MRRVIGLASAMLLLLAGCAQSIHLQSVDLAGHPIDLPAFLEMPSGKGPFSAAVLMHGCGGMATSTEIPGWVRWFNNHEYATLTVDSFTGRGIGIGCGNGSFAGTAGSLSRVDDAKAAFKYLSENPMIDSKRVVLVGFSHGALTVLIASLDWPIIPYAGFIALYPNCGGPTVLSGFTVPTMILIGEADDSTPADACKSGVNYTKGPIELHVYPGAYHGFDRPDRVVFVGNVHIGGNAQATLQAHTDVEHFLTKLGSSAR
jgi:dienelactone hydrolase